MDYNLVNNLRTIFLSEGVADARRDFADKLPNHVFDMLISLDPTKNKKYVYWMSKQLVDGKSSLPQLRDIRKFDEACTKNKIRNKDITSYANMEAIHDALALAEIDEYNRNTDKIKNWLVSTNGNIYRTSLKVAGVTGREGWEKLPESERKRITELVTDIDKQVRDAGTKYKNFDIDEDILDEVMALPAERRWIGPKAVVVKITSFGEAKLYGRDHKFGKVPGYTRTSAWCISRPGSYWSNYFYDGLNNFYVILPRSVEYVPEEKYNKLMLQVYQNGDVDIWDYWDNTLSSTEAHKIMNLYSIPFNDNPKEIKKVRNSNPGRGRG